MTLLWDRIRLVPMVPDDNSHHCRTPIGDELLQMTLALRFDANVIPGTQNLWLTSGYAGYNESSKGTNYINDI